MEATKKTSMAKAALLVIAALSMLLSGLFIATASRSDASPPPACPENAVLTADGKACAFPAVVTTVDNPNTCDVGELTPDGTKCWVAARVIPQEGNTICPKGYSPDDSLGGMCARFEAASQRGPACPEGAEGSPGGCYIRVAKGPRGDAECAEGTLVGGRCVITGPAPTNGASSCPVSATVLQDGSECYTLIARPAVAGSCDAAAGYFEFGSVCKINNTGTDQASVTAFACPAPATGETVTENMHTTDGITKVESCEYAPASGTGPCPTNTTDDPGGDCRRPVDLRPGALECGDGFGLVGGECIRYETPGSSLPQCPIGSAENPTNGDCEKPVADQAGAYYCADSNAALNGKSCVFTAGFLIEPAPSLFKCDDGDRTVIGSGDAVQVICILGDANANAQGPTPSCLQGVLSTDNAFCIVPRIDTAPAAAVAAPVPSFTG